MAKRKGFTSDQLGSIFTEAVRQGWTPDEKRKSGHAYITCPHPECHHREVFSRTCNAAMHKLQNKISAMRKHGFVWQGRGGEHVAPLFGRREETV